MLTLVGVSIRAQKRTGYISMKNIPREYMKRVLYVLVLIPSFFLLLVLSFLLRVRSAVLLGYTLRSLNHGRLENLNKLLSTTHLSTTTHIFLEKRLPS